MAGLTDTLREALINQAKVELETYLKYTQAAHWFELRHLTGIASFYKKEADGERTHFEGFLNYLSLRNVPVEIRTPTVTVPNWESELPIFEYFLDAEVKNYENIKAIFKLARDENDYDVERFLSYYIQHQVEAVDEWEGHVEKVKSFTAMPGLIWHLDAIINSENTQDNVRQAALSHLVVRRSSKVQPEIQEEVIQSPRSNSSRNQPHIPLISNIPSLPVNMTESGANSAHPSNQSNFKSTIIPGSSREPLWSTLPAPIAQRNMPASSEIQYMDRFILTSQIESFLAEERESNSVINQPMTLNDSEITSIEIHGSDCTEIENIFLENEVQITEEVIDRRTPRSLSSRSSKCKSQIYRENPQPSPRPSVVPSPKLLGFIQNLKFVYLPEENTELKRARTQTNSEIPNPFIITPRETSSRATRPKLTPVTPFRFNRKKPVSAYNLETQDHSPIHEDPVLYKFQDEIQEELACSDQWPQDSNSSAAKFVYEEDSPPPYSYAKSNEASENFFHFSASNL